MAELQQRCATAANPAALDPAVPWLMRSHNCKLSSCWKQGRVLMEGCVAACNALIIKCSIRACRDTSTNDRSQAWLCAWQAGLDSLGAVELRSAMGQHFSVQLPATVAFDYPTPAALADFIASRLPMPGQEQLIEPVLEVGRVPTSSDASRCCSAMTNSIPADACGQFCMLCQQVVVKGSFYRLFPEHGVQLHLAL